MNDLIVIIYTTLYKKGGGQFKIVAETMASEKRDEGLQVECSSADSKQDIYALFSKIKFNKMLIKELHFIGHSGMYGPMFGSVEYPEQFSPHELKTLQIPFEKEASATFHSCRSARWFAPYFSRVQHVKTLGYHWYTTFSSDKYKFSHPSYAKKQGNLYLFGCPGKKSHGLIVALKKRLGFAKAEQLKIFNPTLENIDTSYNNVAELYANTFKDIKVRRDEFSWILKHFPSKEDVSMLDIGCGNGALLKEFANRLSKGVGVDASENLLKYAKELNKSYANLDFIKVDSPALPFNDNSFDLVVSLLSFRYLDWDLIIEEVNRVLTSNGQLIIIDMVTAPVRIWELPLFLKSKVNHYLDRSRFAAFYENLRKLVTHKDWAKMLHYNPIRSQHEMVNYLKSRYPNGEIKVINIGLHSRVLAFQAQVK